MSQSYTDDLSEGEDIVHNLQPMRVHHESPDESDDHDMDASPTTRPRNPFCPESVQGNSDFELTDEEAEWASRFFHWCYDDRRDAEYTQDPGETAADLRDDAPEGVPTEWVTAALKYMKLQFLCRDLNILQFYCASFRIDPYTIGSTSVVREKAMRATQDMGFVLLFMKFRNMLNADTDDGTSTRGYSQRIFTSISYGAKLITLAMQTLTTGNDEIFAARQKDDIEATHFQFADKAKQDKNRRLQVYLHLLNILQQKSIRRFGKDCYTQITCTDTRGHIRKTYAWKKLCTIQEFIHDNITKELDYEMWEKFRSGGDEAKYLQQWLIDSNEKEFEELQYDDMFRSFRGDELGRNGGLQHMAGAFFAWDKQTEWEAVATRCNSFWNFMGYGPTSRKPIQCRVPTRKTCAIKYFEEAFDSKWCDVELIYRAHLEEPDVYGEEHVSIVYDAEMQQWHAGPQYPPGTAYGMSAIEQQVPDGCARALTWVRHDGEPTHGYQLKCNALRSNLARQRGTSVTFDEERWDRFALTGVRNDHFVVVDQYHWRPAPPSVDGETYEQYINDRQWHWKRAPDGTGLDKLTNDQTLHEITRFVLYAYFGRALVPMRCRDDFQSAGYMLGKAGSGKSTFLNLLTSCYPEEVVEVLSPQSETTFVLMNLYKAKLVIWPEAEGDPDKSGLGTADLKVMIEGGRTAVRIKHAEALSVNWPSQLWMAGNTPPMWKMNGLDILRRVVVFEWTRQVTETDQTLPARLHEHIGSFIGRSACCHLALVLRLGSKGIWQKGSDGELLIGPQIEEASKQIRRRLDPLYRFLDELPDTLKLDDEYNDGPRSCVPEETFLSQFNSWVKSVKAKSHEWRPEHYTPVFKDFNLTMEEDVLFTDGPEQRTCRCVCGIRQVAQNST